MWVNAAEASKKELEQRLSRRGKMLKFGIDYLDDAAGGIAPCDLVLLGASSGVGKTQVACEIARETLLARKKVAYFALEADLYEIEARFKFPMVADRYWKKPWPLQGGKSFSFANWFQGMFAEEMKGIEAEVSLEFGKNFRELFSFYKQEHFGLDEFVVGFAEIANQVDLIIVDHLHYFDIDDDNENRALKKIAKTARKLALEDNKPIILISHLRKRDRLNQDIVPGIDEFHGSSDLTKIATKVITIAPGQLLPDGNYTTYFRVPKNRWNGGVTRNCGKGIFSPKKGGYERGYKLGWADQKNGTDFVEVDRVFYPEWAENSNPTGVSKPDGDIRDDAKGEPGAPPLKNWASHLPDSPKRT